MNLVITNQTSQRLPRKYLHDFFAFSELCLRQRKVLRSSKDLELLLVFLPEKQARRINRQFRGKDYATDVLSFDNGDPELIGELILCPPVLKRQATEHGLSFRDETAYMLLHGFLHLLGFEHEGSARKAREMFSLQDEIFELFLSS